MLSIDGTLVVQLINFIVFLLILNAIFMKPVGAAIARRREFVDGLKHDVEQLQRDAAAFRGTADERRAAARREADEAIARARVAAGSESDTVIAAAQQRAAEIIAQAHAEVDREIATARAEEARLVDALANDLLERAIGGAA
jgi:F-type H+-transporting ATPase subunit b